MADAEILDLEEGGGETGEISNLCIVGKILSPKMLNVAAVSNILTAAWRCKSPFSVVSWNNNVFLFRFENSEDKTSVLKEGPWSVMNNLLVLIELVDGAAISDLDFSKCPFWVQVHGLPVGKMSRSNAEIIGRRFGKLLAIEASFHRGNTPLPEFPSC